MGSVVFENTPVVLNVNGEAVIRFDPPEEKDAPYRLNAVFRDPNGNLLTQVVDNEWQGPTSSWDLSVTGTRYAVRHARGDIRLAWRLEANADLEIVIESLKVGYAQVEVDVRNDGTLKVTRPNGEWNIFGPDLTLRGGSSSITVIGNEVYLGHFPGPGT